MSRSRVSKQPSHAECLGDQEPFDEPRSRAQIRGLMKVLAGSPKRLLDLGCGAGRVLAPLAAAGHHVRGIDADARALARCRATLSSGRADAELIHADFTKAIPGLQRFDAILCLGNTFMTIADVAVAAELLKRIARRLKPTGAFIIDDFPYEFWRELTEGNWINGMSRDGSMQLVWKPGDAVFTFRTGRRADASRWTLRRGDQLYRLWCEGSLRLLARSAGLSAPQRMQAAGLIMMRRREA